MYVIKLVVHFQELSNGILHVAFDEEMLSQLPFKIKPLIPSVVTKRVEI